MHTAATTAEAATTSPSVMGGIPRTKAGEVAWRTGDLSQKTWTERQRAREQAFYGSVNVARASALAVATSMADTNSYDIPTTANSYGITPSTAAVAAVAADPNANPPVAAVTAVTAVTLPGPAKALVTATTNRDAITKTSNKIVPATRAQSTTSGEEW